MSETCSNSSADKSVNVDERLGEVRRRIDAIDLQLLSLLNERSALSQEVGHIKAGGPGPIFKPQRELDILDRLSKENRGPLPEKHLRIIWREIFSSSRALQRPLRVAYLGPEGTFSYFAGVEYLGHGAFYRACTNIPQVFEEVNAGSCELGVVPLENSLQGTVGISFDLFMKYPVIIQAELYSRISHCLLSTEDTLTAIKKVYSHPQPLSQCGNWLRSNLPQASLVPLESTAASAHRSLKEPGTAAIGNGNLTEMMNLNILARNIEDASDNWTRFVIIGPASATPEARFANPDTQGDKTKTSILFTLPDKPGSLSEVLDVLAINHVNMRKLESRPLSGQSWRYVFFADVEQNLMLPRYEKLLDSLNTACTSFRILGAYAMGPQLDRVWSPDDTRDLDKNSLTSHL